RAGLHAAARVLPQWTAVLPHPAREVLSISGPTGDAAARAASPARHSAGRAPLCLLCLGTWRPRGRTGNVPAGQDELSSPHRGGYPRRPRLFSTIPMGRAPGVTLPPCPASGGWSSWGVARPDG